MKIITDAIKDGRFALEYGKFGPKDQNGMPHISFPFEVINYPKETKAFALIFIDYDAVPVSGAPFIHWLVSDFTSPVIKKGASHQGDLIEGINSWYHGRNNKIDAHGYGGMAPPDKPHIYTLYVFALKEKLGLKDGFFFNDLIRVLPKQILAFAKIEGIYPS